MTKTDTASPATIESATTSLRRAERELAEAFAQREKVQARLRLAQTDLSHEEANAGAAVDRVIAGEAKDSLREQAMLAEARAALDAVMQAGTRGEQAIGDAQAAVAQAQRGVLIATADAGLRATLDAVPALEDAVQALATAYHAINDAHGVAKNALARLTHGRPIVLPDMPLARLLGVALQRERIDISQFEAGPGSASFHLSTPIGEVAANVERVIDGLREKAAA